MATMALTWRQQRQENADDDDADSDDNNNNHSHQLNNKVTSLGDTCESVKWLNELANVINGDGDDDGHGDGDGDADEAYRLQWHDMGPLGNDIDIWCVYCHLKHEQSSVKGYWY